MRVGLLGDTHANKSWIKFALWKFNQEGITTILQVGDFGIYRSQGVLEYLKLANLEAIKYNQTLYVVPGNHEDWTWINELYADESRTTEDGWTTLRSNILIAPRGLRWTWGSSSFVALGGAPSIDRAWRRKMDAAHPDAKNPLWDAGEMITWEDVEKVVAGGYADVMVAHDAPEGVASIDNRINTPSSMSRWETADLMYAADGRRRMTVAYEGVAPRFFFHGHYHFKVDEMVRRPSSAVAEDTPDSERWCNIIGLDCDHSNNALGCFDTETKEAVIWNTRNDLHKFYVREVNYV